MQWYYADESDQQHEIAENRLGELARAGAIRPDTLVWNETLEDWKECREVRPDLFDPAAEAPPAAPPVLTPAQRQAAAGATGSLQTTAAAPTDPLAVTALVCGILGLLCFQLFSIVGVITGHIAYRRASEESVPTGNKGMALAGIIMGYIGLLLLLVIILFYGGIFALGLASESMGPDISTELVPEVAPE